MVYKKLSNPLKSVMASSVKSARTSLNTIIKDVKRTDPELGSSQLRRVSKVMKKLNENPGAVTRHEGRMAMEELGKAGELQSPYKDSPAAALRRVQKEATAEAPSVTQPKRGLFKIKEENSQQGRMYARARAQRREAAQEEKDRQHGAVRSASDNSRATRSIGLEQWKGASVSISQAIKSDAAPPDSGEAPAAPEVHSGGEKPIIDLPID